MKSRLNQRWLMVGVVWLAVFAMTFLNFNKIDAVSQARENCERLRKENLFQKRHTDKLLQVTDLYGEHFKPVASVNLGFEHVRSSMQALAALLGLQNVQIDSQPGQATTEQLEFMIRMQGPCPKALGFVTALATYPYLSVQHSRILVDSVADDAEIEIELLFNFKITPREAIEPVPLNASAGSPA